MKDMAVHSPTFQCRACHADACYIIIDTHDVFKSVTVPCHGCGAYNTVKLTIERIDGGTRMKHPEPQIIFSTMLEVVTRVRSFKSDLFHDAIALHNASVGDGDCKRLARPFLWFIGEAGTHIMWLFSKPAPSIVASCADVHPDIYFFDGYTLAPISLDEAKRATA